MAIGDNDDVIDSAVVRIGPDLTGFRKKLEADLTKAVAGASRTIKIKLVADGAGLRDSVAAAVKQQMALKNQPVYKVKVVADAKGLQKTIADAGETTKTAAKRSEAELTKIHAKGVRDRRQADKLAAEQAGRDAQANLVKLKVRGLKEELKRVRNANEDLQRAKGQADKADAERQLTQVRDLNEKVEKARDQAGKADTQRQMTQARNLDEKLEQARGQAEKADTERQMTQVRNLAEKIAKAEVSARLTELQQEMTQVRNLREKLEKARVDAERANREREAKQVRSESEKREKELAEAQRTERDREAKQIRSDAEAREKQIGDAIVADQARTNNRVRNAQEAGARLRQQAQDADFARDRQKYRTHQEYLDGQHEAALRNDIDREKRASSERTKILDAENKRRAKAFKSITSGPKIINYGGQGIRPMNLLYGVVAAMTPALFAMSASAVQAATSIAALGSAGIGTAFAISGLLVAFRGIGDLLKLRKTTKDQETTSAANAAQKAVTAADDLAKSKRALADAQRDEKDAQQDVHKARREAIRDLEDLRQAVIDLDNQYRSDTLSVAEAKQNAAATDRNFFATALERQRAHQDVRDAQTKLKDTGLERKQKKEDLKTSVSKGVEGSDKVRDAKERARDAADRTKDARDDLTKQRTTSKGVNNVSSAAANLKKKIGELSPAAQEMYYWFDKNEGLFKRLQRQISQKTLPGFNTFLKSITAKPKGGKSTLEIAAQYAGDLGAIIGKYAGEFGKWTKTPFFRSSMAKIQETNAKAFDHLGEALLTLADPLTRIFVNAAPGFESLSDTLLDLSKRFSDWIKKLDESGALKKWFEDSRVEAGKWYRIAKNILTLLKNLFTASLPAGGSLVSSFEKFTKTLADWSGSPEGIREIKDFFDKIANLPYAKILDFFKNGAVFFAGFRAFKFLVSLNPFMLAFAAFAAANPAAAAEAFGKIAGYIGDIMGYLAEHPKQLAGLLAIFAAAKLGKAVGLSIKLPVMDRLRNALTSKFKFLDKFIGGGKTATMTVHAGVVNVYGPVGPGAGGPAGAAAGKVGLGAVFAGVGLAAAVAMIVYAVDKYQQRRADLKTPLGGEKYAFGNLQNDIARYGPLGQPKNDPKVVNRKAFQDYIAARKKSVDALVEETKKTDGVAAAKIVERRETQRTSDTLTIMLQKYGWTETKARDYSDAISGLNTLNYEFQQQNLTTQNGLKDTGKELDNTGNKARAAAEGFDSLKNKMDKVTGQAVIELKVNGLTTAITDLDQVAVYQQLIRQGKAPTEANIRRQQQVHKKSEGDGGNAWAQGGRVTGYSPHPKADNIPAMLTADEYVHPVAAVKHYGTDFMEAVRTRRFPKLAEGGSVQKWPFKVPVPENAADVVDPRQMYYGIGGGKASGSVKVAELAEQTARAMGATQKQLIALMAAGLVESGMRSINYGDRDSVGFLQQRPSQGWGSVKQLLDPAYATRKFILAARRMDNGKISAGELAARVQRPRSDLRYKYGTREADAVAILNRMAPFINVGMGTGSGGSKSGLVAFGRWLQVRGYSVTENPSFGGVHAGHVPGSWHYKAGAIDVNRGAGTSKKEQKYLAAIIPEAHRRGFNTIFMAPGHYDHAHVDIGKKYADGGLVPAKKYDTGGVLPPGYTLAFNGTGANETIRTAQQERGLQGPLRLDRRDLVLLAGAIRAGGSAMVNMDGRKVAELTNQYNYLPAGV